MESRHLIAVQEHAEMKSGQRSGTVRGGIGRAANGNERAMQAVQPRREKEGFCSGEEGGGRSGL